MFCNAIWFLFIACILTTATASIANTPPQYKPQNWVSIWAGTSVALELAQSLEIGSLSIGSVVRFKVYEDVIINGKTVIKAGTTAYSRVRQIELCADATDCQAFAIIAETTKAVDGQTINLNSIEQDFKISTRPKKKVIYSQTVLNATVLNTQKIKS